MRTSTILRSAVAILSLAVSGSRAAEPPPEGTFSGQGLTLTLKRDGNQYTGTANLNGHTYDLKGMFDAGTGLRGAYSEGGTAFEWIVVSDGRTLTFLAGGAGYKLAIPETAPATAAQPPAARPAPAPGLGAAEETLRFTRLTVRDPGINNIEAISFLIPEGWKAEGGVQWFPDYSRLANLLMTITDPKTGAQIQFLPIQNFTWTDQWAVPIAEGTNYMGNIVHRPVMDVPEFIRLFFTREALPHLAAARQVRSEELPRVAEEVSKAWNGQARVSAARVRYEYERAGKAWEEDVFVTLVASSGSGFTIWSDSTAYSFRAPMGELDRLEPRMATVVSTGRLGADWYSGYMYVQQLFMNRTNQGIRDAAAISATITRNSEEIRRMFHDSYAKQCESQDRINRNFSESIRGVETYQNPFDHRPVALPSGYTDAWVNAQGEYILSAQAGFDPNVGSSADWQKMEQAK